MKKQGLTVTMILSLGLVFTFCKKTKIPDHPNEATEQTSDLTSGLREDFTSINGYLYANYQTTGTFSLGSLNSYAAFGDPERNLMATYDHFKEQQVLAALSGTVNDTQGNIAAGTLSYNGINLYQSTSSSVVSYYSNSFTNNITLTNIKNKWVSSGNQTFRALNHTISRGFPRIKDTVFSIITTPTLSIAGGYSLDIPAIASNYDSLTVLLSDGFNSSTTHTIKKTVTPGQNVSFSKAELLNFSTGNNAYIDFSAYNYSGQTLYGKKYVFELSRKSNHWSISIRP